MSYAGMREPFSVYEKIGKNITIIRRSRGMLQTSLANEIGVQYQMIGKYETGATRIPAGRAIDIARVLQVPTDVLFGLQPFEPERVS